MLLTFGRLAAGGPSFVVDLWLEEAEPLFTLLLLLVTL